MENGHLHWNDDLPKGFVIEGSQSIIRSNCKFKSRCVPFNIITQILMGLSKCMMHIIFL